MNNNEEYCLIQDNSSHWYIVPYERKEEAETYFRELDEYWLQNGWELPPEPSYLVRINGYMDVIFTNYRME